jgi:aquaporin Z
MDNPLRCYLADAVGSFIVVFIGAGTVCAASVTSEPQPWSALVPAVALAQGCAFAFALVLSARFGGGCVNPALTIMMWVCRRFDFSRAAGLVVAQLLGAALAGLAVRLLFPEDALFRARLATPHLQGYLIAPDGVTLAGLGAGVALEAVLTFIVAFAVFTTLLDPRVIRPGGLGGGLTLTGAILVAYPLTGAALNPARWFGPALWQMTVPSLSATPLFTDHAVYWAGPIVGALAAGVLYSAALLPAPK